MRNLKSRFTTLALLVPLSLSAQVPAAGSTAQAKPGYAGSATCLDCHKKEAEPYLNSAMGKVLNGHPRNDKERLGCESCHGSGKLHAESGGDDKTGLITFGKKDKTPVADKNAACLSCHENSARTLWKGSAHESRNVACTDCHTVMHENTESASLKKSSVLSTCGNCHLDKQAAVRKFAHMPLGEGKMECVSCHAPHGSANEKLLIGSSVNETCFSCHAEKRGPFMWEHAPVTESCATCHNSHGSTKQRMLINALPRLCQNCHLTPHGAPSGRPSDQSAVRFNYNKGCVNCHSLIHGSNHPTGIFFTR